MKYYQAVYQTDAHGFNVVYSKNIWTTEEDAQEYIEELKRLMPSLMQDSWVTALFTDESE